MKLRCDKEQRFAEARTATSGLARTVAVAAAAEALWQHRHRAQNLPPITACPACRHLANLNPKASGLHQLPIDAPTALHPPNAHCPEPGFASVSLSPLRAAASPEQIVHHVFRSVVSNSSELPSQLLSSFLPRAEASTSSLAVSVPPPLVGASPPPRAVHPANIPMSPVPSMRFVAPSPENASSPT